MDKYSICLLSDHSHRLLNIIPSSLPSKIVLLWWGQNKDSLLGITSWQREGMRTGNGGGGPFLSSPSADTLCQTD